MAPFWRWNTTSGFRKLPLEDPDPPPEENPFDAYRKFLRIAGELGLVSAVFTGVYVQRHEMIYGSSPETIVAKVLVLLAGAAAFGTSVGSLYNGSFLAPGYNYRRPPRPRRRWRRYRAQQR